jgi:hypothetical protein
MIFLYLLFLIPLSWADPDGLCEILKIENCKSVTRQARRASAQSLPSPVVAGGINPANVSQDKGLGLEMIHHPHNPLTLSFVSGTGKIGGAIISSSMENAFFGNRIPEVDEVNRRDKKEHFRSDKITAGTSFALYKNRKFGVDLGLMGKYHPDAKKFTPGVGISARLGIFNLGVSQYKDTFTLKMPGKTSYQESFDVQTLTAGVRIKNLFLDYGIVQSNFELNDLGDSKIKILSAAYVWNRFMFNLARRSENSRLLKYNYDLKELEEKQKASDFYGGIQYALNRYVVIGIQYNYFLMRDTSFSAVVFF